MLTKARLHQRGNRSAFLRNLRALGTGQDASGRTSLGCRQSPLQRFRGIPAAARGLSGDKTLGLAADGLEGWGEPAVEGRADTVVGAVTELVCYLPGQDPNQVEGIVEL